ncbi:MAG: peptidylprolyl isomerase [Deltaproteobacteria bacterium]|nr:peptidylprolyl isomerase [Deltaproteobacteria bacterium]
MLDHFAKRFQTTVLIVVVFMVSAVFILEFGGPQSRGCVAFFEDRLYAAKVQGRLLSVGDFRAAYALPGFNYYQPEQAKALRLRELTLDGMIERELLANAALEIGFRVSKEEVLDDLFERGIIYLNPPVDAPPGYPGPEIDVSHAFEDQDGNFSAKRVRNYLANTLRRSNEEFIEWQIRERLAYLLRQAIIEQVVVSPEEVKAAYVREKERARIEYVQFRPVFYRDRVERSEDSIAAWMREHAKELDEEYERKKANYQGLEPQVRARHILIKVSANASEEERKRAKAKAEELLQRVKRGEDFAALARAESQDEGSAKRGGDLGYNPRGRMVAPFEEAMFSTPVGQIVDRVVETQYGYHVIKVEGRREGNVPEEEAKREIAEELYVRSRAQEMAREEAEHALAFWKDGHSSEEFEEWLSKRYQSPSGDRDPLAPQLRETGAFRRIEVPIAGAFDASPLTQAAFSLSMDRPFPEAPLRLGDDWFIFRLKERSHASEEGFTEEVRRGFERELLASKRAEVLRGFVYELRRRAQERGEIRIDERILRYGIERDQGEGSDEDDRESSLLFEKHRRKG